MRGRRQVETLVVSLPPPCSQCSVLSIQFLRSSLYAVCSISVVSRMLLMPIASYTSIMVLEETGHYE
jgi:hypothetical protein